MVADRYHRARKNDKGLILDEFVKLTGYSRRYTSHFLISHGRHRLLANERKRHQIKGRGNTKPGALKNVVPKIPEIL